MRILIIRPGAIGDALLAFHILKIVKAEYAHITFVSNANVLPLAHAFGLAEETFDYADSSWSELFSTGGIRTQAMQDMLQQTDLAICWLRDPDGIVEHNLRKAGVRRVIVAPGRPSEGEQVHIVDYLAATIGLQKVGAQWSEASGAHFNPSSNERQSNEKLTTIRRGEGGDEGKGAALLPLWQDKSAMVLLPALPRLSVGGPANQPPAAGEEVPQTSCHKGPLHPSQPPSPLPTRVAIHPGSGSTSKCWPAHNFTAVIEHLVQRTIPVLLLAGPADVKRTQHMLGHLTSYLATGMLQVLENAALLRVADCLKQCRGYLGNDSGITHLAAMLGVPTLALFGPTDPLIWHPVGPSVKILQQDPLEHLPINVVIDTMNAFYLKENIESHRTSGGKSGGLPMETLRNMKT